MGCEPRDRQHPLRLGLAWWRGSGRRTVEAGPPTCPLCFQQLARPQCAGRWPLGRVLGASSIQQDVDIWWGSPWPVTLLAFPCFRVLALAETCAP